jgi:beta-glucosidase
MSNARFGSPYSRPRGAIRRGQGTAHATTILTIAATAAAVAGAILAPGGALAQGLPYQNPSLPVATRVNDLLSRMSLDEKLGQMTQAERLSVTNAQITQFRLGSLLSGGGSAPSPNNATSWANMYDGFQGAALATPLAIPLIYGVDAVHGHNNVQGATIFPHNIGLGATRDPALVQNIGRATAEEVSGTGIDWDFAPCLCVARNDRWGRTYESFRSTSRRSCRAGTRWSPRGCRAARARAWRTCCSAWPSRPASCR